MFISTPSLSCSSNVFVVLSATKNLLPLTSVIPPTAVITTSSPLEYPCDVAVTTAGLAFVIADIVLSPSNTAPLSLYTLIFKLENSNI
uniref:Putative tail tubular protein B n=1 Tax=uncultured marine virus TaxID=186617 RepID=A0A0F7L7Q0_9VIRU|nr:putative tail tubular protein B [uncultured marine virus]